MLKSLAPVSYHLDTIGGVARQEADGDPVSTSYLQDIRWDSRLHSKLPDLYVKVKLGDVSKQTRVVKQNLTPSWDEALTLSSYPQADLIVELRHKSSWRSDPCVGYSSIRLDELSRMCAESEGTRPSPIFLLKKGSRAPAGTLYLRLETADLISNAELDVKAVTDDIQQPTRMKAGSTTAAALADGIEQLSTEGDLYRYIEDLFSKLDVFVGFIDDISKIHPYLTVTWQVTSSLYKCVSNQFKADKRVIELVRTVVEAFNFVRDINTLPDKSRHLEETIISLLKQTTECCLFVKDYARRGFAGRMLDIGSITKIDEFSESVAALKKALDSSIGLNTAFVSARILDKVDAIYLRTQLNPDMMSAFNRPLCLPGTRSEIQKQIIDWMVSDSDQNIFWLYGVAGSGKSTISTTIAEHFRGLHRLGAFLFFERGKSDPSSVIRTMAFGLACADSNIAKQISTAIDREGDLASASAAVQFKKLILNPLTSSAPDFHGPILIVLDALDECGTLETRGTLLELMRQELHILPKNIRILITSRKETDIEEALSYQPEFVQEVELDYSSEDSQRDVLEYIRVEMTRRVKDKVPIPEDWPWEANMILLANAAEGLFVWGSTSVKLVSSRRDDPFQALEDLVSNLRSPGKFGLNDLYSNVLRNSGISWDNQVSRTRFSQVLGMILLSKIPLSIATIDGILGFPPTRSSKYILSGLQCLLVYSPDAPIHLFHTSFSDFLVSSERLDDPWCIDIPTQTAYITARCFGIMKHMLHFNMCDLESSFVPNDRVRGLEDRTKERIPPHLAYACLHWSQHLSESSLSSSLQDELSEFAYNRLLYWFEVLSLLGKVIVGDQAIFSALQWTESISEGRLSKFLTDARRLLAMFSFPISRCTPHIYVSMLPIMSEESSVAAHYSKGASAMASVERIGKRGLTPLLRQFRLADEDNEITVITFSPDCTRIAFVLQDPNIYIYDAESEEIVVGPLIGHRFTTSLAFSPDGAYLVSGLCDGMIQSWNTSNGEIMIDPFEGHADIVSSLAFSPDGNRIVSGSSDKTVIIWDFWNRSILFGPLLKHTDEVRSVDFSPDGARVVSGSVDGSLILWDVESSSTGQVLFLSEKPIRFVKFSPDGARIVCGTDGAVIVWSVLTKEVVWRQSPEDVICVGFSRDGSRIVSGGFGVIRIWNAESGKATNNRLKGHSIGVTPVSFLPDDTRIMSCTVRGEIGIWDVAGAETASESTEGPIGEVTCVAYSPDGSHIISVYRYENMLRIWDVRSGKAVSKPLHGNDNPRCYDFVLSLNSTRLAILGSPAGQAWICDIGSKEVTLNPWLCHHEFVSLMSFSRDGNWFVTCSTDNTTATTISTIKVWAVENGKLLYGPFKREIFVNSLTISSDGMAILLGLYNGTIEVCGVESGNTLVDPFKGHTDRISTLIFSSCGTRLASGSGDNTIIIWNYGSGQIVSTLYGHTNTILSISFSPDGLRVASSSWDRTVRVWDVFSGELKSKFGPIMGFSNALCSVSFSPDGTSIISGSRDGVIRNWDLTKGPDKEQKREITNETGSSPLNYTGSSKWVLDEDGWIRGDHGKLLLWVPPALHATLWYPENIALFGGEFQTKLDFTNCAHGESWQECFNTSLYT